MLSDIAEGIVTFICKHKATWINSHTWTSSIAIHRLNVSNFKRNKICPGLKTTEILTCIRVWLKASKKLPSWSTSEDVSTLVNTSLNTESFPNTPESGCKMNCAFCSLDSKPNTATCRTRHVYYTFCSHQVHKENEGQLPVFSTKIQRPTLPTTVQSIANPQEIYTWCSWDVTHAREICI